MTVDIAARHEASHASAAALLGLPVTGLAIGPSGGVMTGVRPTESPADLRRELTATLAPLVEHGTEPAWPLSPHTTGDARDVHTLTFALGLDNPGYQRVIVETRALTQRPRYKRLRAAIERAAVERGVLDQRSLERLVVESRPRSRPGRKAMSRAERSADISKRLTTLERKAVRDEQMADLDQLEQQLKHADQDRRARRVAAEFKGLLGQ